MKKEKICKKCGAIVNKGDKSCTQCGVKIKKPFYKRLWFWLVIVMLIFLIIGGNSDNESEIDTETNSEVEETVDIDTGKLEDSNSTIIEKENTNDKGSGNSNRTSIEDMREIVESVIEEVDDNIQIVLITDNGILLNMFVEDVEEEIDAAQKGNKKAYSDWSYMLDSMATATLQIKARFEDEGYPSNYVVSIEVVDKNNTDVVYASSSNGQILVDVVDDALGIIR